MTDADIRERIARAIEARADAIEGELEAMIPEGDELTFYPQARPILQPRINGLREAARIARETPDDDATPTATRTNSA